MDHLPCPHCAGQSLDLMEDAPAGIRRCWVACNGCGATGPWASSPAAAWRLWDRRELSAVLLDCAVRDRGRQRIAARAKRVSVEFLAPASME